MLFVLLLLAAFFSWVTIEEQHPTGADAGRQAAERVLASASPGAKVLILVRATADSRAFAEAAREGLAGDLQVRVVEGDQVAARAALQTAAAEGGLEFIVGDDVALAWRLVKSRGTLFPALASSQLVGAESYRWPNFLKVENLLNVANQIAVIAIIAIGMTLVIITAGIDLSVGSLIALAAVVAAWSIRELAGAKEASVAAMVLCSLVGIGACALIGLGAGFFITLFRLPPFIVTLSVLFIARGVAFRITGSQSISELPDSFVWLGRGADLLSLPNSVVLMLALYVLAHILMSRMVLGRYVYAVGGNAEAARLSGVPVRRVLLFVYTLSGALAGVGGIILASQLQSGSPLYGETYELYVIAAVVVGGTSISGGEGKVLGTLIGALIIGVIQNGMNLTGVESKTQLIVFGAIILLAVLVDRLKRTPSAS